jgi:hypothetical protein
MSVPKKLLALANDGDTTAQCRVADAFMRPETSAAYRRAMPWLRRAARAGEAWAAYHLGLIYDDGLGVPRNSRAARTWYEKSAAAGCPSAQLNLGVLLANLPGKRRDLRCAIKLYRLAAARGRKRAAYNLGLYYACGHGLRRNLALARLWLSRSGLRNPAREVNSLRDRAASLFPA